MAPGDDNSLRMTELTSLRNELLQNEKTVHDRIMYIFVALGVAYYTVFAGKEKPADPLLICSVSLLFIIIFWINLRLTIKKVTNNARIIAYICLVHEPNPKCEWIGWEHAIKRYRGQNKENKKTTDLFYTEIYEVSMVAVVIIFSVVLSEVYIPNLHQPPQFNITQFLSIVFFVSFILFISFAYWKKKEHAQ